MAEGARTRGRRRGLAPAPGGKGGPGAFDGVGGLGESGVHLGVRRGLRSSAAPRPRAYGQCPRRLRRAAHGRAVAGERLAQSAERDRVEPGEEGAGRLPGGGFGGSSGVTAVPRGQRVASRPSASRCGRMSSGVAAGVPPGASGGSRMPASRGWAAMRSRTVNSSAPRPGSASAPVCVLGGVGLRDDVAVTDDRAVGAVGEHDGIHVPRARRAPGTSRDAARIPRERVQPVGDASSALSPLVVGGGVLAAATGTAPAGSPARSSGQREVRAAPQLPGPNRRPPHPRPHGVDGRISPTRAALPGLGRRSAPQHHGHGRRLCDHRLPAAEDDDEQMARGSTMAAATSG